MMECIERERRDVHRKIRPYGVWTRYGTLKKDGVYRSERVG